MNWKRLKSRFCPYAYYMREVTRVMDKMMDIYEEYTSKLVYPDPTEIVEEAGVTGWFIGANATALNDLYQTLEDVAKSYARRKLMRITITSYHSGGFGVNFTPWHQNNRSSYHSWGLEVKYKSAYKEHPLDPVSKRTLIFQQNGSRILGSNVEVLKMTPVLSGILKGFHVVFKEDRAVWGRWEAASHL